MNTANFINVEVQVCYSFSTHNIFSAKAKESIIVVWIIEEIRLEDRQHVSSTQLSKTLTFASYTKTMQNGAGEVVEVSYCYYSRDSHEIIQKFPCMEVAKFASHNWTFWPQPRADVFRHCTLQRVKESMVHLVTWRPLSTITGQCSSTAQILQYITKALCNLSENIFSVLHVCVSMCVLARACMCVCMCDCVCVCVCAPVFVHYSSIHVCLCMWCVCACVCVCVCVCERERERSLDCLICFCFCLLVNFIWLCLVRIRI